MRRLARWSLGVALVASPASALAQQPAPGQLPPPQPAPPGWNPNVQSGGLAPPPPLCLPPFCNPTPPPPAEPKKEPPKRRLNFFWAQVEGGYSHAGFQTFDGLDDATLAAAVPKSGNGGDVGLGLGARIFVLTLGARGRLSFYDRFQTVALGGEVGLHLPFGRVEPHVDLGGGWLKMLTLDAPLTAGGSPLSVEGGYLRLQGGVDFFPHPMVSLGVAIDGNLLFTTARAGALSGDAVGGAVALNAVLGLHI